MVVSFLIMGPQGKYFDYSQRAQWLRAVVLGGIEGIAFTTLRVMGVEKVADNSSTTNEMKVMLISTSLGLIAGTMRLAISEFVSAYTQVDIVNFQAKRDLNMGRSVDQRVPVPNAIQITVAASLAFLFWGTVPILAAGFIKDHHLRFSIALAAAALSMVILGIVEAAFGKAPIMRSFVRVIVGGFVAISIMWAKVRIIEIFLGFRSVKG